MALSSSVRETRLGVILGIIVASYLMIGIDMSIVNVALPTMRAALGFSTVGLAWVVNAYMLAYGGLLFLGGRSGDIVGRKRSLLFGVILFTAASALGGFAPNAWLLLASRVLQGVGAAFAAPSTMALLITSFPEGQPRNRALSFYSAAASLGSHHRPRARRRADGSALLAMGVLRERAGGHRPCHPRADRSQGNRAA